MINPTTGPALVGVNVQLHMDRRLDVLRFDDTRFWLNELFPDHPLSSYEPQIPTGFIRTGSAPRNSEDFLRLMELLNGLDGGRVLYTMSSAAASHIDSMLFLFEEGRLLGVEGPNEQNLGGGTFWYQDTSDIWNQVVSEVEKTIIPQMDGRPFFMAAPSVVFHLLDGFVPSFAGNTINLHYYTSEGAAPSALTQSRKWQTAREFLAADDSEIVGRVMSEVGWRADQVTDVLQSSYLESALLHLEQIVAPGGVNASGQVPLFCPFKLWDDPEDVVPSKRWGLVSREGTPRPSFYMIQAAARARIDNFQ